MQRMLRGLNRLLTRMLSALGIRIGTLVGPNHGTRLRRQQRRSLRTGVLWLALAAASGAAMWPSDHAASAGAGSPPTASRPGHPAAWRSGGLFHRRRREAADATEVAQGRGGVAWRFGQRGQSRPSRSDPRGAHMPEYGGHDPVAIARQSMRIPAVPDLWTIHNDRLFLFASAGQPARQFLADPGISVAAAGRSELAARSARRPSPVITRKPRRVRGSHQATKRWHLELARHLSVADRPPVDRQAPRRRRRTAPRHPPRYPIPMCGQSRG